MKSHWLIMPLAGLLLAGCASVKVVRELNNQQLTATGETPIARLNPAMTFIYVTGAGTDSTETAAARKPQTVAGPTSGPATAFASRPTTLICPEIAVTTGWVASCAARGTATASASQAGAHRDNTAVQRPAHHNRPADAVTDSANPIDRAIQGSQSTRPSTATDR